MARPLPHLWDVCPSRCFVTATKKSDFLPKELQCLETTLVIPKWPMATLSLRYFIAEELNSRRVSQEGGPNTIFCTTMYFQKVCGANCRHSLPAPLWHQYFGNPWPGCKEKEGTLQVSSLQNVLNYPSQSQTGAKRSKAKHTNLSLLQYGRPQWHPC